jgi:hypothetical protein
MKPVSSAPAPGTPARRRLARHALQWAALGLGLSARPATTAAPAEPEGHRQWLAGQSLQPEDPDAIDWLRLVGGGLQLRARSYRRLVLCLAPDPGLQTTQDGRRLGRLQWRCELESGVRWQSLTVCDGASVRALIAGEHLAGQCVDWPEALPIAHGLLLRWELQADAQDRRLSWQDVQLDWV